MNSVHVMIVGPEPSLPNGISNFVTALSNYLANVPNLSVTIFNETAVKRYTGLDNSSTIRMLRGSLKMIRAYKDTVRRLRPDIIHLNSAYGRSLFEKVWMAREARRMQIPSVVHLHGSKLDMELPCLSAPIRHWIEGSFSACHEAIVLSEHMRRIVQETLPTVRTTIIPPLVPLIQSAPPLRASPVCLGFIGMLIRRKGVADLIRAMARSRNRSYDLLIAGGGPLRDVLGAHIVEEGLEKRIRFLGVIDEARKDLFFQSIDLLCLPSHNENMPIALLEAMNYGRPVIATSVGSVPETIKDGVHGWLVPPRDIDKLATILDLAVSDPEELRRRGQRARELVEAGYTWDANGPNYLTTYYRLLGLTRERQGNDTYGANKVDRHKTVWLQ